MTSHLLLAFTAVLTLAGNAMAQSSASGRVLVANQQSASASIVDLSTGVVTHVPVGPGPHEAAISPDGKLGFISVYGTATSVGSQIAVIDLDAGKVIRTIDLGLYTRPHGLVVVPGSPLKLVITSETTRNVVTVNAETGVTLSVVPTNAAGSHMVAVTADGTRAFTANVGDGTMSALDLATGKLIGSTPIAPRAEGLATTPDGREVWVGSNEHRTVTVVKAATLRVDTVLAGFGVPYRLAVSPDSRVVAVVEAAANRLSVHDIATRGLLGTVDLGGSPRGVTISADSRTAFVTLGPQNQVTVVDLETLKVVSRHTVGAAPDGIAYSSRR